MNIPLGRCLNVSATTTSGLEVIIKTSDRNFLDGFVLRPDLKEGRMWTTWSADGRSIQNRNYDLAKIN